MKIIPRIFWRGWRRCGLLVSALFLCLSAPAAMTPEQLNVEFPLGPDSLPQPGVPQGRLEKHTFASSRVFPGTVRDYYIYVPVQYDPAKPACVMVIQDGYAHIRPERRWHMPVILDNLIHKGDIPVCIGIFIDPGEIPPTIPGGSPRPNRSFEYDSLSDRYARFIVDEMLPEVGRHYNLTRDPGSRLIMGGSSGAVCAFNVAWQRPDVFQRVLSIVGSYTALRGGHNLAPLVRLTEPKPLRIFLESGQSDLVVYAGSWWTANEDMLAALEYSGYEVNHIWAKDAGHNDYHCTSIFPDALRWIWKDYPRPIRAGVNSKQPLAHVLIPGEDWKPVGGDYHSAGALAANSRGDVFFADERGQRVCRIGADGRTETFAGGIGGVADLSFGPDGTLYACQPRLERVLALDPAGRSRVALEGIAASSLAVAANGNRYAVDPANRRIWLITPGGERRVVDASLAAPRFARLTHDQGQLIVDESPGRRASIFSVEPDGSLANGAPFFRLNLPDEEDDAKAGQIAPHPKGWSAFATSLGIQLACNNGIVAAIIPTPDPREVTGVVFGGPNSEELYVSCENKIYRRKIQSPDQIWY